MGRTSQSQEKRPRERPGVEPPRSAAPDRQRIIGGLSAGVLVVALAAGIFVLASPADDSGTVAEGAFGTHYEGLEQRRLAAAVPTMSDPAAPAAEHIHPELAVYVRGEQVPIPVNIGIDPSRPPELMAGLHTHDSSGVIHVENAAEPTLGQFFEIWGVPFSADRLGPHEASGDESVRVWVDGQPSQEFGDLVLEDGQQVVVAYGTAAETPPDVEG